MTKMQKILNFIWIKIKLLLFYSLHSIKYICLILVLMLFISGISIKPIPIKSNTNFSSTISRFSPQYTKIDKLPLLKAYTYQFNNNEIYMRFQKRVALFLVNNEIFDEEGFLINENIENIQTSHLIKVTKNKKDFFSVYKIFSPFLKNKNIQIELDYIFIRWNVTIIYKNHRYTIKLPSEINSVTRRKINFFFKNINDILQENDNIIDLRFNGKIYITK